MIQQSTIVPLRHGVPYPQNENIIAVASGKGGVGKTWFSVTLAHALAQKGEKILLFDGDLGLANLDIQLGLTPRNDLSGVISGKFSLNEAVLTYRDGNGHVFDIISGRSGSGGMAQVPISRLRLLGDDLDLLSRDYNHVIIDLGAGLERTVRSLSGNASHCIVVVTDEPTSLTDAYAFIKVTHMESPGISFSIIVNMANSTREGERTYNTLLKACQGFLHISPDLLGVIRRDNKVKEAIKNQSSLLTRSPNSQAALDVEAISSALFLK